MEEAQKIELLAPVGSMAVLEAALEAGANALYLGLKNLNARSGAANFTPSELEEAVQRAHAKGSRVYLTLNTQLTQQELGMAARSVILAQQLHVDGVLVTDPAYLTLAEFVPNLPIHFSTQAGISSSAGVEAARCLGVSRVVLARELSFDEIKAASAVQGVQTEVFVQGAMCFSCSGRCLLSSWGGGRSGNRGNCSSPCRVLWKNQDGVEARPMSMLDLSLLEWLGALDNVGVASLKIEGRLKSPEWVSQAVSIYRHALDGTRPLEELRQQVQRLGDYTGRDMTDGYVRGERSQMTGDSGRPACGGCSIAATIKEYVVALEEIADGSVNWHFSCGENSTVFRTPPQRLPNPHRATTFSNAFETMQDYCKEKKLQLKELEGFDYFRTRLLSRNAANSAAEAFAAFARSQEKQEDGVPRGITVPEEMKARLQVRGQANSNTLTLGMPADRVRGYIEQLENLKGELQKCQKILVLRYSELEKLDWNRILKVHPQVIALPQVVYEGQLPGCRQVARQCAQHKIAVEVNSWDTWNLAREEGAVMEAGTGLAVMNAVAAAKLSELGCRCTAVSPELDKASLEQLCAAASTPLSLIVASHPVLMTTRAQLPELFTQRMEDARNITLSVEKDGELTLLRPTAIQDWRKIRNPRIRVSHLVLDLCGSPEAEGTSLFNYERRLK